MRELDIRDLEEDEEITRIRFSDDDWLEQGSFALDIVTGTHRRQQSRVYLSDIDNLILALKKAKELWMK